MTDDRPVWLLDVDGVLNVADTTTTHPPHSAGWPDESWMWGTANDGYKDWPILAAHTVLDTVRWAHNNQLAQIRWLTTWEHRDAVRNIERLFEFPEFPIAGREEDNRSPRFSDYTWWWKLPIAQRVYAENPDRLLLWTDDDITRFRSAREWTKTQPKGRVVAISPNPGMGLIPAHVDRINDMLDPARV